MLTTFLILVLLVVFLVIFLNQEKFGKRPSGKRLENLKNSPHYLKDSFDNLSDTPALTEGVSYYQALKELIFDKNKRKRPSHPIPSIKTNLLNVQPAENILVWFGHSSYFIQLDGKRILVDPVFSGHASPISFTTKAFEGSNIYGVEDMPEIDYLFITHDHWDHMDYDTLTGLRSKVNHVICALGVGAHLTYWGYKQEHITEKDWGEHFILEDGFDVQTVPARHFSGRGLKRNQTLWTSFALKTPSFNIFIGGDSGYDAHFKSAGDKLGPFDLVILENGQYDHKWKYIHMHPDEVVLAAKDLKGKRLLAVHSSKFSLSKHSWDEPLKKVSKISKIEDVSLMTPKIGEPVYLNDPDQKFTEWWQEID
mgnify:CR=1 FL=1